MKLSGDAVRNGLNCYDVTSVRERLHRHPIHKQKRFFRNDFRHDIHDLRPSQHLKTLRTASGHVWVHVDSTMDRAKEQFHQQGRTHHMHNRDISEVKGILEKHADT
jgi:hypothetical protein